jgi:hypothetical protein
VTSYVCGVWGTGQHNVLLGGIVPGGKTPTLISGPTYGLKRPLKLRGFCEARPQSAQEAHRSCPVRWTTSSLAQAEIWKSWRETCTSNNHPQAAELFNPDKLPAFYDPFAGAAPFRWRHSS